MKGTPEIRRAVAKLIAEGWPLDYVELSGVPNAEVLRQIRAAVDALQSNLPGAVVVTGGDRLFAAGADITEFKGPDEARSIGGLFLDAFNAVAALPRRCP